MKKLYRFKNSNMRASHAFVKSDKELGEYEIIHALSTPDEIPHEYYCYLPVQRYPNVDKLNNTYEGLYEVEATEDIRQLTNAKISRFKRALNDHTFGTFMKVLVPINDGFLYGYIPTDLLNRIN